MTTFAELLTTIHQEQFVGRAKELRVFDQWLARDLESGAPPILAVCGPGGIGKSWLLEAFARRAATAGWAGQYVDLSAATLGALLGGQSSVLGSAADTAQTVLFIDGIDEIGPALPLLLRELATLEAGTRVVLSARSGLRGKAWRRWQPLMRHVDVGPLDIAAQRRYLDLRGVDIPARRSQILLRAGGNPLVLSLAVDLVLNSPHADLEHSTLWRSAVRANVDELITEVGAQFRDALDAAAVLQRFDRDGLAAVLPREVAEAGFVRLCSLSVIKTTGTQLTLHDDVRRAVIEDLRLHNPGRLDALRRRALRYHRNVAARASGDEGQRLAIERMHMVGRDMDGLNLLYEDDLPVTIGPACVEDIDDMLQLLQRSAPVPGVPRIERDPALLCPILEHADTAVQVAHDHDGNLVAYGFYLRLSEGNRKLVGATDAMASIIDALVEKLGCPHGRLPEDSNIYYLSTIVIDTDADPAVITTMSRPIVHLFLREGAYLTMPARPEYIAVNDGALATPLVSGLVEDGAELHDRFLDLSRCGYEGWLRSMLAGGPIRQVPVGTELAAIVRDLVSRLDDDAALAASHLSLLAEPDEDVDLAERARAVRDLLARSIQTTAAWPTPELRVRDALGLAGEHVMASLRQAMAVASRMDEIAFGAEHAASESPAEQPAFAQAASSGIAAQQGTGRTIALLGGFELWQHGTKVPVPQGAVSTVLKVVALRRVVTGDELIEILWPDSDPAVGRERLRTVLARLRRAVGSDIVVRKGDAVVLADDVSVDAAVFSGLATVALALPRGEAKRATSAQTALGHYRGPLLPEDRFADWAVAPRERLLRLHLSLLDAIVEAAEAAGDVTYALRCLEQAIEADPYEEQRYAHAARLLADTGRRGHALVMVQRAEAAAASLGVPLSSHITALRQSLRASA